MNLDTDTRKDLEEILKLSRTVRWLIGVIRGMAPRYLDLLRKQIQVEKENGLLALVHVNADGEEISRMRLDLRL